MKVALFTALLLLFAIGSAYAVRSSNNVTNLVGPGSSLERVFAKLPFVEKELCLGLPNTEMPFGSIDQTTLNQWIPRLRYATNSENLAIVTGPEDSPVMRQRFIPSAKGSLRVVTSINLRQSHVYEVEQSVMFEPDFQWGSEAKSGKFGFGFAGGSAPTGGAMVNDGFSARLMWKGHADGTASVGAYLYTVDRTQNLPYGDEFLFPGFTLELGEWFDVKMRLQTNSSLKASDGRIQIWINDELLFDRPNIQWQSEGQPPMIDQVLYSTFHGGNSALWSPQNVVHAQFSDMCVYKDRAIIEAEAEAEAEEEEEEEEEEVMISEDRVDE